MKTDRSIIIRTYLIYFAVVAAMAVAIGKTIFIIIDGRPNLFNDEGGGKIIKRTADIDPRRGEILDDEMNPLVTSVYFYDIYMDPITVKDKLWDENIGALCAELANTFQDKTAREYEERLRKARANKKRFVLIQRKVTNEQRKLLRTFPIFKEGRIKGGIIDNQEIIVRKRTNGELLSRTLGYVRKNKKDTLKIGIEGAYDEYLAGQKGVIIQQLISNSWKSTGAVVKDPINGYDLVTSFNKDIQEVAHTELERQLKTKGGKYGVAIVMEVKTGFIKAMVNLQQSENSDTIYREVYNNAIGRRDVLGSTMKLASILALLEDNKAKLSDTLNAFGEYKFYNQKLTDDKKGGYGRITLKQAFEKSSNVISKVVFDAYKDDPNTYIDRLNKFGLTQKTGITLVGEPMPDFSKPGEKRWWGGSLAWMAIGYEYQLTPLQMLSFYNAVANNGDYMEPQFIQKVIDNRHTIKEFKPKVRHKKIASKESIDAMKDALEGVVLEGTAKQLQSASFNIAGKTGTAQIANNNKGFAAKGSKKYVASFVGYFPANDPIYSCIVVVSAPSNDIYGVSVSGTVFAAIANKVYASSYNFHKAINEAPALATVPTVKSGSQHETSTVLNRLAINTSINGTSEWIKTSSIEKKGIEYNNLKVSNGEVPDVRGMGLTDALYLLEKQGLVVQSSGFGRVITQSIAPNTEATPGRVIELNLKPE